MRGVLYCRRMRSTLGQGRGCSSCGQSATSQRRNGSLFSPSLLPAATWRSGTPCCAVRWSSRGEVNGGGSVSGVLAQVLSVFHVPLPLFGGVSYCVWCTRRYLAAAHGGRDSPPSVVGAVMATHGERFGEGRLTAGFFVVVVRFMYCFSCEVHIVVMLTELCKFGLFAVLKGIIGSVMWTRGGKTDVHVHVTFQPSCRSGIVIVQWDLGPLY
jgi:hypothetical protein